MYCNVYCSVLTISSPSYKTSTTSTSTTFIIIIIIIIQHPHLHSSPSLTHYRHLCLLQSHLQLHRCLSPFIQRCVALLSSPLVFCPCSAVILHCLNPASLSLLCPSSHSSRRVSLSSSLVSSSVTSCCPLPRCLYLHPPVLSCAVSCFAACPLRPPAKPTLLTCSLSLSLPLPPTRPIRSRAKWVTGRRYTWQCEKGKMRSSLCSTS